MVALRDPGAEIKMRPRKVATDAERQFECVALVYFRLQLLGDLPKKASRGGFHIEAYGKDELGLTDKEIKRVRARARAHMERFTGKLPWWK